MSRILVTGAAGFIGSHTVDRLLAAGHTVAGIDNLRTGRVQNLGAALGSPRFTFVEGDVATGFRALDLPPFDHAVSNPPYFDDPGALRSPAPRKRGAWMADDGLAAWTRFLLKAVREGGTITVIHRADRLADLLTLLDDTGGSFAVRPVHAFADEPAKRVLVRAVKTGKAPLRLLPALVLHDRQGDKHTAAAEAILRGEASLPF